MEKAKAMVDGEKVKSGLARAKTAKD